MEVAEHSSHLHTHSPGHLCIHGARGEHWKCYVVQTRGGMTKVTRFSPTARCLDSWQSAPAVVIDQGELVREVPVCSGCTVGASLDVLSLVIAKREKDGPRLMVDP